MQLYATAIVFACGIAVLIYGVIGILSGTRALYYQILTFAVGAFTLGRLYEILTFLTAGELPDRAHLGLMGTIGMAVFFLTASKGTMDAVIDDRRKELARYRLMGLIAPICMVCLVVPTVLIGEKRHGQIFILVLEGVIMLFSLYFEFKHLIFPDEGLEFAKNIRSANIFAIVLSFTSYIMLYTQMMNIDIVYTIACVIAGASAIGLIFSAKKGVASWLQ